MIWVDAEGEPLTGERSYTIRFEQRPPVDAFWSITMYDVPEFFLVANPIDRYSIGDRTPGLRHDDDGALTLVLQRDDPGDGERSELAADPARRLQTAPAHVRAASRGLRRQLRAAAHRPARLSLRRAGLPQVGRIDALHAHRLVARLAPRTTLTRDGATPARAAMSRQSASLARPSTGGALTRTA